MTEQEYRAQRALGTFRWRMASVNIFYIYKKDPRSSLNFNRFIVEEHVSFKKASRIIHERLNTDEKIKAYLDSIIKYGVCHFHYDPGIAQPYWKTTQTGFGTTFKGSIRELIGTPYLKITSIRVWQWADEIITHNMNIIPEHCDIIY